MEFAGAAAGRYEYTIGDRDAADVARSSRWARRRSRARSEFDKDRLATKTGPFTIERKGPGGAVSKITDGKLSLAYAYDANGRPAARTLTVGGTERFFQKLTFDNVGRAGAREERVDGGALDTLAYGYDGSGQLLTVKRGATRVEDHTYDANGNRLGGGAAYDDRDRLTTRGGVGYTWDADGFLKPAAPTRSPTGRRGELLSATAGGRRSRTPTTPSGAGPPAGCDRSTSTATRRTRSR